MFDYMPEREFFKLTLKPKKDEVELNNVTKTMEKRKHELMLKKLDELQSKIEIEDMDEETEKITAYEYDMKKLDEMVTNLKTDKYGAMLAVEKIMDSLGIENYRLRLFKNEDLENEIEEIMQEFEEDDEYEDEYDDSNLLYEELGEVSYANLYKYEGRFYVANLEMYKEKKNLQLREGEIYFKKPLEIPIKDITSKFIGDVCEKTKNDGRVYIQMERIDLQEFLYKNYEEEKDYNEEIGKD